MEKYIDVLRKKLNELQEEAEALEQVIYILEKESESKTKKSKKRITTDSGLSFVVSSETKPAVEPVVMEDRYDDDFDINNIPNKAGGILDL